jgi:ligand-binding sensor domain-containing protein/signal transduction histidine kinase
MSCLSGRGLAGVPALFVAFLLAVLAQNALFVSNAHAGLQYGLPIAARNADGQVEVFRVDADGQLQHRWQRASNGDWSSWSTLGGKFLPEVVLVQNAAGELNAFAIEQGSGGLCQCSQRATNSHDWTGWVRIGEKVRPPLAAVQDREGIIELFAVDARTSEVRQFRQTTNGAWSSPSRLGGKIGEDLAVARERDGRLHLFGLDTLKRGHQTAVPSSSGTASNILSRGSGNSEGNGDSNAAREDTGTPAKAEPDAGGRVVHCWQTAGGWSAWADLGGSILPTIFVGQNANGLLEVFGLNTNGHVNRLVQRAANEPEAWKEWEDFGGEFEQGIALGQSADSRLEVLAVQRETGVLMHRWELLVDGSDRWSAWATLGNTARPWPAVAQNEDGNLEVFALDRTNSAVINHRRQISKASDWLDWASLDHTTFRYSSRTWQIDEGLPDNVVQAIAQTRDGYLWLGTREGLARFDGTTFTVFNEKNTPELKTSGINVLCADRQGTLWIGTDGGGLVRLAAGRFHHFDESLVGNNIRAIHERRDGTLWIGTTNGMIEYKERRFTKFTQKDGLSSDLVTAIFEDKAGDLWIGTGKGLNRFKDGTMEAFAMPNQLPGDSVRTICQDKGGRIWIGSNNGMLWYNWYWSKSFYAYNSKYGLSDAFVSAICEDREGNLWVGTYSGLNRFREGRFFTELKNEGIPFERVNALFEDREGNLWVGSREGLTRLTAERFVAYTKRQGLSHNNVMSVLEDEEGSMWIATWGGGLNRMKDENIVAYSSSNGFPQVLTLSLARGQEGSVWIGSDFEGGLAHFKDGRFKLYTVKDGLPAAGIKVIQEAACGDVWIGTSHGISNLRDGTFRNYSARNGFANIIRAICEDHTGTIWIGTDQGLSKLQNPGLTRTNGAEVFSTFTERDGLSDNNVTAIYEDKESDLWIGTAGGGLNRFRNGQFTAYGSAQGLFSDEIFDILEDDSGWLWMTCSRGIFRVRKRDLDAFDQGRATVVASLVYGKIDGMESQQCNGGGKPGAWKARDGKLWFPTSIGLVCVDPSTVKVNPIPPPVYIEQLYADRRPLIRDRLLSHDLIAPVVEPAGFTADEPLQVPAGRGELEFNFAVINFHAPDKCRVKYKLEGVDSDWVDAGSRRSAHYNNILPGEYHFRVTACNEDGIWNQVGAALPVLVLPHFWQTWWFETMAAILMVGTVLGAARYAFLRRMRMRLLELEQRQALEKERARIAKDMHDQIGAGLTQVGLLGELARRNSEKPAQAQTYAAKICELAREQAQTLDEIVWTIEPRNDSLNKLAAYIAAYAEQFLASASIRCRLDIPAVVPPLPVSAEVRHNFFLVVKEALHNVVKHSRATDARLSLSSEERTVEVVIEDNGRGFDLTTLDGTGNGLASMKERMEEIGGTFHLEPNGGKGTRIRCKVLLADGPEGNGNGALTVSASERRGTPSQVESD